MRHHSKQKLMLLSALNTVSFPLTPGGYLITVSTKGSENAGCRLRMLYAHQSVALVNEHVEAGSF